MTLDPVYCADGCGRLAETERPLGMFPAGDLIDGEEVHSYELVCYQHRALEETG